MSAPSRFPNTQTALRLRYGGDPCPRPQAEEGHGPLCRGYGPQVRDLLPKVALLGAAEKVSPISLDSR